jgi:hypothetical protein
MVISFLPGDLIRVLSVGEPQDDIDYRIEGAGCWLTSM